MKQNRYSKKREKVIDSANSRLIKSLREAQDSLADRIEKHIMELDRDGDTLQDNLRNISKIAQLNNIYRDFIQDQASKVARPLISSLNELHDTNADYFKDITGKSVTKSADEAKKRTFRSFGIDGRKIIIGGLLHSVLFDESPVNKLKSYLLNALKTPVKIKEVLNRFETIARGRGRTGIFERHVLERMPEPFQRFDRATGTIIATDLQLNFAVYQGGTVRDSRPFCKIRNNQVYSREEIARFGTSQDQYGGYTNKSAGEFQGKPALYDPFSDLGGYNCRHQLDWISDELAYVLRPDLRPTE